MRISLCLITKNEEKNIKRCIESVKNIVSELIVVDTGSVDRTIEIAQTLGAKVYHYEWIDDFSAARNFAIDKASGEWIIFLDADEYLEENDAKKLKQCIFEAYKNNLDCIVCSSLNIDSTNNKTQTVLKNAKIFKKDINIRYQGIVHEILYHKKRQLKCLDVSKFIKIIHVGYTEEEYISKDKANRNLKLLYKQLSDKPDNTVVMNYIAESLMADYKFEEALTYLEKALSLLPTKVSRTGLTVRYNILSCYKNLGKEFSLIENAYLDFIAYDNNFSDFYFIMGLIALEHQKLEEATKYLEICLCKIEKYRYDVQSRAESQVKELVQTLFNVYIIQKSYTLAIPKGILLLKYNKYEYKVAYDLINILVENERVEDVFSLLNQIYDLSLIKDKIYLLTICNKVNCNELYQLVYDYLSEEEKQYYEQSLKEIDKESVVEEIIDDSMTAMECYNLALIYNKEGNVSLSKRLHQKAFEKDDKFAETLLKQQHPNFSYRYAYEKEKINDKCPLCGTIGKMHSVYNTIANVDFISGYNPIRVWMHCELCNHIFANNYPENIEAIVNTQDTLYDRKPLLNMLHLNGDIVRNIKRYISKQDNYKNRFLDVGIGSGEMLLTALEFDFDVTGVDIRRKLVDNARERLNVNIYCSDFVNFSSKGQYDVICLGDVIEHLENPLIVLDKVNELLVREGIVWISTPNFESAFSRIMKYNDPMWTVVEHINYFSFESLKKILAMKGFEILDYGMSKRYNGSMEVIARKK